LLDTFKLTLGDGGLGEVGLAAIGGGFSGAGTSSSSSLLDSEPDVPDEDSSVEVPPLSETLGAGGAGDASSMRTLADASGLSRGGGSGGWCRSVDATNEALRLQTHSPGERQRFGFGHGVFMCVCVYVCAR
jgi:hypothetical protein